MAEENVAALDDVATVGTETTPEGKPVSNNYNAEQIGVLEGLEGVRKRPGMYIGSTQERGFHHCVFEVIDNSIDEFMAGFGKRIFVSMNADGSCTVKDEGRGIPVDEHPKYHRPAVEIALTKLHAGGKFNNNAYTYSGGLHGVGSSCVNALSEWMEVDVCRGGKRYRIRFSRGKVSEELHVIGDAEGTGTSVTFKLDNGIFKNDDDSECIFKWDVLAKRFTQLAFLNPGITITLFDEVSGRSQDFYCPGGIPEYLRAINRGAELITPQVVMLSGSEVLKDGDLAGKTVHAEVGFVYVKDKWDETIDAFTNGIYNPIGGTHLEGFKLALTNAINGFAKGKKLVKEGDLPSGEDIRQGISCVVKVLHPDPTFNDQEKTTLIIKDVRPVVNKIASSWLKDFLEENPKIGADIVEKILQSKRAREAADRAKKDVLRKKVTDIGGLLGKLADCQSNNPKECELFLVEGDSAGGSAVSGRDSNTQAILPLRGKVLNVEKAGLDRQMENNEIRTMITAIGGGFDHDEEVIEKDENGVARKYLKHIPFDVTAIKYDKIIIMTDADVDGAHIRTLLLTFFYRKMRSLIEHGHVYMAQPPLYGIKRKGKIEYIASDSALTGRLLKLGSQDFRFVFADGKRTIEGDQLQSLLDILATAELQCKTLAKQKVDMKEFFSTRNPESGEFPHYLVVSDTDGNQVMNLVFKKEDADVIKLKVQETLQCPMEELDEPENPNFNCTEIKQAETLRREMDNLVQVYGFNRGDFLGGEAAIGKLVDSKGAEREVTSLLELLDEIRERGRKGLSIQRYKGLGEMDYDQLYDTTMDPKNRRLRRAELVDAAEADKIFQKLMGDDVIPRRRFIEDNALLADIDA